MTKSSGIVGTISAVKASTRAAIFATLNRTRITQGYLTPIYRKEAVAELTTRIPPDRPVENAFIESFYGRFRDEYPNEHVFRGLPMARRIIEAWWRDYNVCCRHTSLGGLAPNEF